jgi:hypothetical protein
MSGLSFERAAEQQMSNMVKRMPPALKHGAYSAMNLLPGESAAGFAKLHEELVTEWAPNGVLEREIVATMASVLWRKKNLQTLRLAKLAQEHVMQLHSAVVAGLGANPAPDQIVQVERSWLETCRAAEKQARQELGELYALAEMGEEATTDYLLKELQVIERLDAMIDRCIKQLLMVRGLKSISVGQALTPSQTIPRSAA